MTGPEPLSAPLDLTRQRRLRELLTCTFSLQARWFAVFFSVTAIVNVPVVIGVDGVWNRQLRDGPNGDGPLAAGVASFLLGSIVLPALVTALHVRIVQALASGERPTVPGAFRLIRGAVIPALAATTIYTVGTLVGTLALLIPGIFLAVHWYFAPMLAVVDGRGGSAATTASGELVHGRWWRVAGNLTVLAIITFAVVGVPTMFLRHGDDALAYVIVQALLGTTMLSATALFGTLLFFSLRVSGESTAAGRNV